MWNRQESWKAQPEMKIGKLVFVVDFNLPCGSWKKVLVTQVFEDDLGCVRRMMLKLDNGVLMHDIRKLCLLEEELLTENQPC